MHSQMCLLGLIYLNRLEAGCGGTHPAEGLRQEQREPGGKPGLHNKFQKSLNYSVTLAKTNPSINKLVKAGMNKVYSIYT